MHARWAASGKAARERRERWRERRGGPCSAPLIGCGIGQPIEALERCAAAASVGQATLRPLPALAPRAAVRGAFPPPRRCRLGAAPLISSGPSHNAEPRSPRTGPQRTARTEDKCHKHRRPCCPEHAVELNSGSSRAYNRWGEDGKAPAARSLKRSLPRAYAPSKEHARWAQACATARGRIACNCACHRPMRPASTCAAAAAAAGLPPPPQPPWCEAS